MKASILKNKMTWLIGILVGLATIIGFTCDAYQKVKAASYKLIYEPMVQETVKSMVKKKSLISPDDNGGGSNKSADHGTHIHDSRGKIRRRAVKR